MESYSTKLYEDLTAQLTDLESAQTDPIARARQAVDLVTEALGNLRAHFSGYSWENPREEITFFKHVKPRFQSRLIYYLKVFHLESHCVALTPPACRTFLQEELSRIRQFFSHNQEFYQYYKTGAKYLDEWFFVRNQVDLNLMDDDFFMALDPTFCTVHSYKISRMLAYNALTEYVSRRLDRLEPAPSVSAQYPAINWTATKADLIELLYALHSAGVINHSQVDVRIIARILEAVFSIKLGNYYRAFQDIRNRKKNRTPFLDLLKDTLLRRMETTDLSICGS